MPVERKPLFRPDVLRVHLAGFRLPANVESCRPNLQRWAELVASGHIDSFKEQEVLADLLTDVFCNYSAYEPVRRAAPSDGR
ncbi:MAG: hypothetical protein HUU20_26430 [Pirellulales bacterium]|nr:hypothetical protein [Pirellulales bacterium]